jgi:hypothetical protein
VPDQSFGGEYLERFAQRGPRNAQLLAKGSFIQKRTRGEFAREYPFADGICDLFMQGMDGNGHGRIA